jgi:hypothetical protein
MASNLRIQKPYVLKALSNPLNRPDGPGRHTVAEVFGQKEDSRKRKRSELSIAIDGDSVYLYDVRRPGQTQLRRYTMLTAARLLPRNPSHHTSSLPNRSSPARRVLYDGELLPTRTSTGIPMLPYKTRAPPNPRLDYSKMFCWVLQRRQRQPRMPTSEEARSSTCPLRPAAKRFPRRSASRSRTLIS